MFFNRVSRALPPHLIKASTIFFDFSGGTTPSLSPWKAQTGIFFILQTSFGFPAPQIGMMAAMYIADVYDDVPIAEYAISQIKKAPKRDIYVIDSLRNQKENEILKSHFKNYYVVSVNTDPDIRYGRESRRGRFGERLTKQDFESRDKGEIRMGVGILMALADFSVDANQSKYSVYEQINKILAKINPAT